MSSEENERRDQEAGPGEHPEPQEVLRLTDPKAMRALAHPVRMALLELFAANQTLTATQASEMLGESPANCAFHLRTLAKYGYLKEAGGGRGRERPWTAVHQTIRLSSQDQEPQAVLAARSLSNLFHERVLDRIRRLFAADQWPAGWEGSPQSSVGIHYLTSAETAQVAQAMHEVVERYLDRRDNASLRPAGALPVEIAFFGYPRTDLIGPATGKETDE